MKNLARGLALSVVALGTLVPLQAGPALALDGNLNVEPETVSRVAGSQQLLTATLTQVMGLPASVENQRISFEWDPTNGPGSEEAFCMTDATGVCTAEATTDDAETLEIIAYDEDDGTTPCTGTGVPIPTSDCDEDEGQPEDDTDDTDTVAIEFADATLNVEPEDKTTGPSAEVSLTATVMSDADTPEPLVANVDMEITDGPNNAGLNAAGVDAECDTDPATGICTLKYTPGATTGVDKATAWVDRNDDPGPPPAADPVEGDETEGAEYEGDSDEGKDEGTQPGDPEEDETDVVNVSISGTQVLTLSPTSATKAPGAASGLVAFVSTAGTPNSGVKIAGTVLAGGAHPGTTVTCDTGPDGKCTLNYTGTNLGIDKLRATVDADSNGQPNEADATEDIGNNGGTPEPDTTAVAQITWANPTPPLPPGGGGTAGDSNQCDKSRETAKKKEILIGTKKADKLCGYGGNDTLRGLAGNDTLKGGKGKDTAKGGKGKDRCRAEDEKKSCEK